MINKLTRFFLVGLLLVSWAGSASAAPMSNIPDLKAAYLANIISFTDWHDQAPEVTLCMSSKSEVAHLASFLSGFELGLGRTLQVVVDPESIDNCHVYYWDNQSRVEGSKLPDNQPHLMIISDLDFKDYPQITLYLYLRNLKLRFAVNYQGLHDADYTISSRLLRLAR